MEKKLLELMEKNRKFIGEGEVADYIPALKKANKEEIAICIKKDGKEEFKVGAYNRKFTIQSISKVVALILALIDRGEDYVFTRVGYEGTDEPFNTMYKLDIANVDKPANPMINSGAILTTSMVKGEANEKFERILNFIREIAANPKIGYNEEVYLSEKETGDKNKAMAYLMKANNMLEADVEETLDAYFKQCSIEVDVVDLANIGCFLSRGCKDLDNFGKISRERLTCIVSSIMMNCGMYNYSSQYGSEVGLPSKSGVGGGIMSFVPGSMGIGVYSPGLDENGNSKVGLEIMKDLSKDLNLNIFL